MSDTKWGPPVLGPVCRAMQDQLEFQRKLEDQLWRSFVLPAHILCPRDKRYPIPRHRALVPLVTQAYDGCDEHDTEAAC